MQGRKKMYIAGLYMRLSRDDGTAESSSITTQRKILLSYAKENGFIVYDEYIDDGFSGTNFDRPNFKRMIQDIEDKKINLVLTKDLSRLGRDYITAGQYTEIYFPSKGVRYIAINDGYDSNSPYNDIAPFKNVINEMYARDISKKIRSSFLARMKDGYYIGNFAPYGYKKDPDNKNHLVIDEEVAPIVKEIFNMASIGKRPTDIATHLNNKGIITPIMYRCEKHNLSLDSYPKYKNKRWTSATVSKILKSVAYIGHTAQKKTTKISFKSKVTVNNPREDWIIVENTHSPIIDKNTFELVQRYTKSRTYQKSKGFKNIFSGIAICADCGKSMSTVGTRKKDSPANLACGGYKLYGTSACTNHFIDYNVLYDIVLKSIQQQLALSKEDKEKLVLSIKKEFDKSSKKENSKSELENLNKKSAEIDKKIEKIYEDNFNNKISAETFDKLLSKYENERKITSEKIKRIQESRKKENDNSYLDFFKLVDEYTDIKELDQDLLFRLIDRIEVSQGDYTKTKKGKIKHQKISIFFRFINKPYIAKYVGK